MFWKLHVITFQKTAVLTDAAAGTSSHDKGLTQKYVASNWITFTTTESLKDTCFLNITECTIGQKSVDVSDTLPLYKELHSVLHYFTSRGQRSLAQVR